MKTERQRCEITKDETDALERLIDLAVADLQYNEDPEMMEDVELALSLRRKLSA